MKVDTSRSFAASRFHIPIDFLALVDVRRLDADIHRSRIKLPIKLIADLIPRSAHHRHVRDRIVQRRRSVRDEPGIGDAGDEVEKAAPLVVMFGMHAQQQRTLQAGARASASSPCKLVLARGENALKGRTHIFARSMEPIGRFHASSMASYLRSAIAASTSAARSNSAPQPVDTSASLLSPEEQQSKGETNGVLTPPLDPACDAGDDEDVLLSEKQLAASVSVCKDRQDGNVGARERGATYQVHYECAPGVDDGCSDDTCSDPVKLYQKDSAIKVHYIDVLLRADVHGLGLNIEVTEGSQTALKASSNRLAVASFRRLHGDDIGPAEATGQIQRGDILYSVDGTAVHSLQQLQAQLRVSRSRGEEGDDRASSRFVLLRFLRYTASSKLESDDTASTTSLTTDGDVEANQLDAKDITMPHSLASPFADKQQVTMMLRSLVMKNQALQDELMASRLKQAEQSIQLEQLYALYARTQVDSAASGFSLSKTLRPFARKASTSVGASRSSSSGAPPLVTLKSGGASFSSSITSPLHVEIEFAVQAERERLQAHYQLQREIETRELVLRHEQELQALKETMDKKLEMLECGFHEALRKLESESLTLLDASTTTNSIETCSCGAWMRLQQELYIHQSLEHDGGEEGDDQESAQCVVCHLLTDAQRGSVDKHDPVAEDENGSQAKRMQQVMEALHEYGRIRQDRALYLKKCTSETTDGKTFNVAAKELRPEESESSQP